MILLRGEVITSARWDLVRASPQSFPKACGMTEAHMSSVLTKTTANNNDNYKDVPWNQTHEASDSSLIALLIMLVQAFRCSPVAEGF